MFAGVKRVRGVTVADASGAPAPPLAGRVWVSGVGSGCPEDVVSPPPPDPKARNPPKDRIVTMMTQMRPLEFRLFLIISPTGSDISSIWYN